MQAKILLVTLVATGLAGGAFAQHHPQPPAAAAKESAKPNAPAKPPATRAGMPKGHMMDHGHHGGDAKGHGRMKGGAMHMGGMCPMMVDAGTKMEVKNLPKGVSITLSTDDADAVARLQKAAEGMRLMHEAHAR